MYPSLSCVHTDGGECVLCGSVEAKHGQLCVRESRGEDGASQRGP